jgi:hypothetical protein
LINLYLSWRHKSLRISRRVPQSKERPPHTTSLVLLAPDSAFPLLCPTNTSSQLDAIVTEKARLVNSPGPERYSTLLKQRHFQVGEQVNK